MYLQDSKNVAGSAWGLLPPAPGSRILSGTERRKQSLQPAGIPQQGTALGGLPLTGRSDPANDREGRGLHGDGGKLNVCVKGESQNYQSLGQHSVWMSSTFQLRMCDPLPQTPPAQS